MSKIIEVRVPDIGNFQGVDVIEVDVKPGDEIVIDQSLITLETDKASMDVPATQAGKVVDIKVKVGDKVSENDVILTLEIADQKAETTASAPVAETPAPVAPQASVAATPVASAPEPASTSEQSQVPSDTPQEVEIKVPDIGNFDAVEIIEIGVKEGDRLHIDDSMITLESDKASMEVPATQEGIVKKILVKLGDKVGEGSPILLLETSGQAPVATATPTPSPEPAAPPTPLKPEEVVRPSYGSAPVSPDQSALPYAGPAVRKIAREFGVDLRFVKGTGPKNRILKMDVQEYVKYQLQNQNQNTGTSGGILDLLPWPTIDFSKFGPTETVALSRIKKISGKNLARNWIMIPHVTQQDEADMTELEAFRKSLNAEWAKEGVKVSPLVFIIKAITACLKVFPDFNSSLDGDQLILKKYYHIGFAADTPNGLVVPVIRDADKLGLKELAQALAELSGKARKGTISPTEMSGASFTISSLGGIGGTGFTPIINAPEVAILGVCKSQMKPQWNGQAFEPRLMCPLSLSYDHRVIDGASACRFITYLSKTLADFRRVML